MGQGANMAFEDAWTLSQCVAQTANIETALAEYQKRRVERATTLQIRSSAIEKATYGNSQKPAQPQGEKPSQAIEESEFPDWLYGYKPF